MVRCKSAIVPPWPFVGSGVTVVVVAREIVLQRLVGLGLVAAVLALAPSADASPPDQTWIAGLYDNADFDGVILFITTGLGDVQPGLLCSPRQVRSEEHTSELQSLTNLVCRLLLEKKKTKKK